MADVTDSKSVGSDTVWVRVPPPAPKEKPPFTGGFFFGVGGPHANPANCKPAFCLSPPIRSLRQQVERSETWLHSSSHHRHQAKKAVKCGLFCFSFLNLSKTWQTSVSDDCHFICHFRKNFADFFTETPLVTQFFSQRISSSVAWTLPVQTDCSLCFPLRFAWLQHPDVHRCSPLWNSSSVPARSGSP